ncbi:hypothetical protein ACFFHK_00880 [Gallibacterium trehalosifermentans]|uniref:Uncharacterized protein n=1 Tax=Gallibacterium trehalosifermentans TaxID=516935 RepID=A0ABV6GY24_9PAST
MKITYDQNKNQRNIDERKLPFDLVVDFHWDTAVIEADLRKPYPEQRFIALDLSEKQRDYLF